MYRTNCGGEDIRTSLGGGGTATYIPTPVLLFSLSTLFQMKHSKIQSTRKAKIKAEKTKKGKKKGQEKRKQKTIETATTDEETTSRAPFPYRSHAFGSLVLMDGCLSSLPLILLQTRPVETLRTSHIPTSGSGLKAPPYRASQIRTAAASSQRSLARTPPGALLPF